MEHDSHVQTEQALGKHTTLGLYTINTSCLPFSFLSFFHSLGFFPPTQTTNKPFSMSGAAVYLCGNGGVCTVNAELMRLVGTGSICS